MAGTFASSISFVVTLLQTVLQVPLLLHFWGTTGFGAWVTVHAAISLLTVFDVGHHQYIGNEFTKFASTNGVRLQQILSSALKWSVCLGAVELFLIWLIVTHGLTATLIGVDSESPEALNVGRCLIIYGAYWMTIGSVGGILIRLYPAFGLFARITWWGVAVRCSQFVAVLTTAFAGHEVVAAFAAYCCVTFLVYIFLFKEIRTRFRGIFRFQSSGSVSEGFRAFMNSVMVTAGSALEQLSNAGVILLLSLTLGAAQMSAFATIRTLSNTAIQVTNVLLAPIIPDLIRFQVRSEAWKVHTTFRLVWLGSGTIVNSCLIVSPLLISDLFSWWTKTALEFSLPVFLLLAWAVSARNFGAPLTAYISGLNNVKAQTSISSARGIIAVILAAALLYPFGLIGIAFAVAASEIVSSIVLPCYFAHRALRSIGSSLSLVRLLLPLGHVFTVAVTFSYISFKIGTPVGVVLVALLAAVLNAACQWINLDSETQLRIRRLLSPYFRFYCWNSR